MINKIENWQIPEDLSIYNNCWVKSIIDESNYMYYYITEIDKIEKGDLNGQFHFITKGKTICIPIISANKSSSIIFELQIVVGDCLNNKEPLIFCTKEEVLSHVSENGKQLITFYLKD